MVHIPSEELQRKWGASWHGPMMRGYVAGLRGDMLAEEVEPYMWGHEKGQLDRLSNGVGHEGELVKRRSNASSAEWHSIAQVVVEKRIQQGHLPPDTDGAGLSRRVAYQAVLAPNAIDRMIEILEPLEAEWKQRG